MKKSQIFIACMISIIGFHNIIIISSAADTIINNAIISSLQQQNLLDQFNALAAAGIAGISLAQMVTIPTSVIPMITNDQIKQFTALQIPTFTASQIKAFTLSQITAFEPAQINAFTPTQVGFITPAQISVMSIEQVYEILDNLSITQVQALTMKQIQALPTFAIIIQLPNFTKMQLQFITLPQIASVDVAIAPYIADLSPAQFISLSATQIQKITLANPDQLTPQIAYLSVAQIGSLLSTQIEMISTGHINLMTKSQLNALLAILHNPAITTTYNNRNLGLQLSAIAMAPGTGVPSTAPVDPIEAPVVAKAAAKKDPQYIGSTLDKKTGLYDLNKQTGLAKLNAESSKNIKKSNAGIKKLFTKGKI